MYVGAKGKALAAAPEYRRQKSDRLGVRESGADPLLAGVRSAYCQQSRCASHKDRSSTRLLLQGGDLEDWGSSGHNGWQAEDEGTLELLREQRREHRQQKSSLS